MTKNFLEIDLVNIIASMSLNIPNYPRTFYEAGYRIEYIEKEFYLNKNGKREEVKFDIVLNNIENNESLHLECKGGSISEKQLKKYSEVKSKDVVLVGGVTSNDPNTHQHQIGYVFNSNKEEEIVNELEKYYFFALSCSGEPTTISKGKSKSTDFRNEVLSTLFESPIVYPDYVYEVFRIGATTPDMKIILLINNCLVSFSLRKKDEFVLDDVCAEIFSTEPTFFFENVGKQEQKAVKKRVNKILNEMALYELADYFYWDRISKKGKLTKIKSPSNPIHFKNMRDLATEMADRVNLGKPVPKEYLKGRAEGQTSLFEYE